MAKASAATQAVADESDVVVEDDDTFDPSEIVDFTAGDRDNLDWCAEQLRILLRLPAVAEDDSED